MSDPINHPAHYNVGKIEVDDAIAEWKLGFRLGNVVKYIARSDHKGAPLEDLKKAQWYLEREIKAREFKNTARCHYCGAVAGSAHKSHCLQLIHEAQVREQTRD